MNWDISPDVIRSFIRDVLSTNDSFGVNDPKQVLNAVMNFMEADRIKSVRPSSIVSSQPQETKARSVSGTFNSFLKTGEITVPPGLDIHVIFLDLTFFKSLGEVILKGFLTKKVKKRILIELLTFFKKKKKKREQNEEIGIAVISS